MDLPDLTSLGAISIPVFLALTGFGWKGRELLIEKPRLADLTKRIEALEEEVEANRRDKDAQLADLRQKVLG